MEDVVLIEKRLGEITLAFRDDILTLEQAHALLEEYAELMTALEKLMAWKEVELEARAILEPEYVF